MSDVTFPIELAGRRWDIPRLPFRVVRTVQPALLRQARRISNGNANSALLRLDEASLGQQLDAVAAAIAFVDPSMNSHALGELVFSSADLAVAAITVLRACDLVAGPSPAGLGDEEHAEAAAPALTGPGEAADGGGFGQAAPAPATS